MPSSRETSPTRENDNQRTSTNQNQEYQRPRHQDFTYNPPDSSLATSDQQVNRRDSRDRSQPYGPRERAPIEMILNSQAWQSQEVQNALTQLKEEIPGTQNWDNKVAEILVEYEHKMDELDDTMYRQAKMDTVMDMFKPEGNIYIERQGEIAAQFPGNIFEGNNLIGYISINGPYSESDESGPESDRLIDDSPLIMTPIGIEPDSDTSSIDEITLNNAD